MRNDLDQQQGYVRVIHMTQSPPAAARLSTFVGGRDGPWLIDSMRCVVGESLTTAPRLSVTASSSALPPAGALWQLRGITSNERYVRREEKSVLMSRQEGLGRNASTCAALIPIRKNAAWWALAQDERREVFEAQSHHIEIGLKYLPAVARRLHHCRDLDLSGPFDFLTWFEYAPSDSAAFEELVDALRASPEWAYVDREVDIRLTHTDEKK